MTDHFVVYSNGWLERRCETPIGGFSRRNGKPALLLLLD